MEESPPWIQPGEHSILDRSSRSPAAASGSKRKRGIQDHEFDADTLDTAYPDDRQTPKRPRSRISGDTSNDETPLGRRSIRRKKGARNLSAMSRHHAASTQATPQPPESPVRKSRFQEGSLTDKPCEEPPSLFTRLPHADSGRLSHQEELMEDYQDGMHVPQGSLEAALQFERDTRDQRVIEITTRQKEDGTGLFRFGKSLASSFHPVALWNRLWNEQKAQLTQQNLFEAERKANANTKAEGRGDRVLEAGHVGLPQVALTTPRDSGVAFESSIPPQLQGGSTASHQTQEELIPGSVTRPVLRNVISRLHLRKPSLQNLHQTLRRVASHTNVRDQTDRESSSSLSPSKVEFQEHSLLRSASKYDLKRQQKLSKRVSDLEAKLQKARSDLDEALVQASPAPQLGSKHQRFTPSGTARKARFLPGALPTLPSESALSPTQHSTRAGGEQIITQPRPRIAIDLKTAFDATSEDEDEMTIKASREKPYPVRAEDIFNQSGGESLRDEREFRHNQASTAVSPAKATSKLADSVHQNSDAYHGTTDNRSLLEVQESTSTELDAKLKALEANVRNTQKYKTRKRTGRTEDERDFKPSTEDDDDAEWEEAAQQSKKRKRKFDSNVISNPAGKAPESKRSTPMQNKIGLQIAHIPSPTGRSKPLDRQNAPTGKAHLDVYGESEDELAKVTSRRTSMASEDITLEPVYEEEEETVTVPLKDAPSKPTAKATPARFGYNAVRSCSNSPQKQAEPRNTDEVLQTKDANGTVRRVRMNQLNAKENFEWPDDVF